MPSIENIQSILAWVSLLGFGVAAVALLRFGLGRSARDAGSDSRDQVLLVRENRFLRVVLLGLLALVFAFLTLFFANFR